MLFRSDAGDLCQIYPLNSLPNEINVKDSPVQLGRFSMGFPEDADSVGASSSQLGFESLEDSPEVKEIRARIGKSGIKLRR